MLKLSRPIAIVGATAALAIAGGALVLTGGIKPASAAEPTTTFDVNITVTAGCAFGTTATADINFGSFIGADLYPTLGTIPEQTTTIPINCTKDSAFEIALTPGNSDTTGAGVMTITGGGSATVPYQLYQASGATPWGSGADAKSYTGTGDLDTTSLKVYADVTLPTAPPPAGDYTDTVTVSITP